MGVKKLSKILLGAESTSGTAVPATTYWRGTGTHEDKRVVEFPDDDVGILMGTDRSLTSKLESQINFDETPATYEQLPYILEAGIMTQSPVQDGAGSDRIYTYNFPTTAQRTVRTYTIEHGDDVAAEESEYCFVKEFELTGEEQKAVMAKATWGGRQSTPTTFTGALTIPTVESALFQRGKFFINNVSTFPATSQFTATWKKFSLKVKTGQTAQYYGDGNLYFTNLKQVMPEAILQVTFEHNANTVAELVNWRAETARAVRLDFTGSAVTSAGTTYSTRRLLVDLLGKWSVWGPFEDLNGDNVMVGTLVCRYNTTAASAGRFIVVNDLTALA